MRNPENMYILHALPGFDAIVTEELKNLPERAIIQDQLVHAGRNGMLIVEYHGDVADLLKLRTVDDVFVLVAYYNDLPPKYAALKAIKERLLVSPVVATATRTVRALFPKRGGEGKIRYRVIARQQGEMPYRRIDLQEAVSKGVGLRQDFRWRLAEDGLEFWVTQSHEVAIIGLRVSDETMRHRTYKINHIEASLRPTAAAAMVMLTKPKPMDVFLDPMCGAGTTLIERALFGRYQELHGGDINPEAVETALANVGPRYKPISIHEWDARALPLDEGSITAVTCNLPFGVQISTPEENRRLYPAVMKELKRVMQIGARAALLTNDMRAINRALERTSGMYLDQQHTVIILGRKAQMMVVQKR